MLKSLLNLSQVRGAVGGQYPEGGGGVGPAAKPDLKIACGGEPSVPPHPAPSFPDRGCSCHVSCAVQNFKYVISCVIYQKNGAGLEMSTYVICGFDLPSNLPPCYLGCVGARALALL